MRTSRVDVRGARVDRREDGDVSGVDVESARASGDRIRLERDRARERDEWRLLERERDDEGGGARAWERRM